MASNRSKTLQTVPTPTKMHVLQDELGHQLQQAGTVFALAQKQLEATQVETSGSQIVNLGWKPRMLSAGRQRLRVKVDCFESRGLLLVSLHSTGS